MRRLAALLCALALLALSACAPPAPPEEGGVHVLAATYPIYLLACTVARGAEGVTVERLNTGSVSCLHDYTLTVSDMKKIEEADVILLGGAGLEEFMEDALAASDAAVIDCSEGIELLENLSHHHEEEEEHDHGHFDPHYWMDPDNARIMARNIRDGLTAADPNHSQSYQDGWQEADGTLRRVRDQAQELLEQYLPDGVPGLITFHDGFQYFAAAFGLPLLASIEEEAGSEASAKEIVEIAELVKQYNIPVIFTEVNGSNATANAIARETGCAVARLSMLMDGPDASDADFAGAEHYFQLCGNLRSVINGFWGEGTVDNG